MRIIKLAGKNILIRLTFDYDTGKTKAEVKGHAEGCSSVGNDEVFNEALIRDLMEAEVAGYGKTETVAEGKTIEGELAEKASHRTQPIKKPIVPKPIMGKPEEQQQQYQTPELDTGGMGV